MMLVHDNDLMTINGFGDGNVSKFLNSSYIGFFLCPQLPETLESDAMMDLLQKSNIEIHKVLFGELIESRFTT